MAQLKQKNSNKITLSDIWRDLRRFIARRIYQDEIPFNIAWTKKKITMEEHPPVPYKFQELARFDLPNSDRHYMIYIDRGTNV